MRSKIAKFSTAEVRKWLYLLIFMVLTGCVIATYHQNHSVDRAELVKPAQSTPAIDCSIYSPDAAAKKGQLVLGNPPAQCQAGQQQSLGTDQQVQTVQSAPQHAGGQSTSSSTSAGSYTLPNTQYTPTCYQPLADAAASKRDADINAENAYHESQARAISNKYNNDSSYYQDAQQAETDRHSARIQQIEAQYQTDMANAHCS